MFAVSGAVYFTLSSSQYEEMTVDFCVENIFHNYGDKVVLHDHANCVVFYFSCVVLFTLYTDIKLISCFR